MSIKNSNSTMNSSLETQVTVFSEIPLTALSKQSLQKLSHLLNSKKILRSEEGYERDWRGLASLSKQSFLCDGSGDDPTTKVIQLWCANNPKTATFAYLKEFLGVIDRWDVSDDMIENLVADTKTYQTKLQLCRHTNSDVNIDVNSSTSNFGHGSDPNILTTSDVIRAQKGLPPQMYDAFVLYADADLNYASEMLTKLEDNPEYNYKLCMKDRDLLGGVQFEHVALTKLIDERCKHLIVILTDEFLKSPENNFLVNYTQAVQIQHKTRKIIPLLYEESLDIPRTLKIYTHLRYNPGTENLFNFWTKLAKSIQNINAAANITTPSALYCGMETTSTSAAYGRTSNLTMSQFKLLPTSTSEIPSISIIPPEDARSPIINKRAKLKFLATRTHKNKETNDIVLRNAHSTSQLHTSYQTRNATSMSDLSTTSICTDTKNKRKWSSKFLEKVVRRGTSKLEQA